MCTCVYMRVCVEEEGGGRRYQADIYGAPPTIYLLSITDFIHILRCSMYMYILYFLEYRPGRLFPLHEF